MNHSWYGNERALKVKGFNFIFMLTLNVSNETETSWCKLSLFLSAFKKNTMSIFHFADQKQDKMQERSLT